MMRISKEFRFEASHILPRHPGKCSRLHGHSWRVRVEVEGDLNPETQFVMDFAELGQVVQPLIDWLDHSHLNWIIIYPSSENVAAWLGYKISEKLRRVRFIVSVSETSDSWASWDSFENRYREPSWGSYGVAEEERQELENRAGGGLWSKQAQ